MRLQRVCGGWSLVGGRGTGPFYEPPLRVGSVKGPVPGAGAECTSGRSLEESACGSATPCSPSKSRWVGRSRTSRRPNRVGARPLPGDLGVTSSQSADGDRPPTLFTHTTSEPHCNGRFRPAMEHSRICDAPLGNRERSPTPVTPCVVARFRDEAGSGDSETHRPAGPEGFLRPPPTASRRVPGGRRAGSPPTRPGRRRPRSGRRSAPCSPNCTTPPTPSG